MISSISLSKPVLFHSFSPPVAAITTRRCPLIRIDRRSHLSVTIRCCCSSKGLQKNFESKCYLENQNLALRKCCVSGFAANLLLSHTGQVVALDDLVSGHQNICKLGSAALEENKPTLPLENESDGDSESMMMMM